MVAQQSSLFLLSILCVSVLYYNRVCMCPRQLDHGTYCCVQGTGRRRLLLLCADKKYTGAPRQHKERKGTLFYSSCSHLLPPALLALACLRCSANNAKSSAAQQPCWLTVVYTHAHVNLAQNHHTPIPLRPTAAVYTHTNNTECYHVPHLQRT